MEFILDPAVLISVLAVIFILVVICMVIAVANFILLKKLTKDETGKNLSGIIKMYYDKVELSTAQNVNILKKIEANENNQKLSIQKSGVVKFDSFDDVGGKLSFAMAILDGMNNGIVITTLFGRNSSNTYIKEIKNASCDTALSEYEQEAIKQAMDNFDRNYTSS